MHIHLPHLDGGIIAIIGYLLEVLAEGDLGGQLLERNIFILDCIWLEGSFAPRREIIDEVCIERI